jgi:glutamine amidotransferase
MITMIDYGLGNLRSVQKALEYVGASVQLTDDPALVRAAKKLVLPGVGAFGAGIAALHARGLANAIREAVGQGTPILGICLGMQFLFDESSEMGQHQGLGLLPGRVVRFPQNGLPVPHMGWNQVQHDGTHPLLDGVPAGAYAYFVHSYHCQPANPADLIATTDYGQPIAAITGRGHILGIQFHPEKSQHTGLRILHNYHKMANG